MWLLLEQDLLYLSPVVVGMPETDVSFCTFLGELVCHCVRFSELSVSPRRAKNLLV